MIQDETIKDAAESGEVTNSAQQTTRTPDVTGTFSTSGSTQEELMGYDKQIEALKNAAAAVRQETPEEKKKRERREKSSKVIGAVSDGLSALANLFFTTQYAPSSYNHKNSQLGKVNESIEKAKADRQADTDRYNAFMLRLGDAQNAKARTLREMQAQQEAMKIAREKAAREAEEHGWKAALQPDSLREQKGKADRAESLAASAQAEAALAPEMAQAKLDTEKAHKGSYEATAVASRASAANSYASARAHDRNNPNEFSAWDEQGNEHKFRTKEAADQFAKQHGTWQEEEIISSTTTNSNGEATGRSSRTVTTKKKGGRPARPKVFNPEDYKRDAKKNSKNTPPPLN